MEMQEKQMWQRINKYMKLLKFIPFLRMVAICNNLAFSSLNENSDIDLFIVTKKGRLFFVRTLITGIFHLLGVRRHGDKVAGRFCLSFFVDDGFLDLSSVAIDDDVYLQVWIKTLIPVINDGVYDEFMQKNLWINHGFEQSTLLKKSIVLNERNYFRNFLDWMFNGLLGDLVERFLMTWQLKRARQKASLLPDSSNLIINEHVLKFHNFDRRREYRNLWRKKFGNSLLSVEKFRELNFSKNQENLEV